MLQTHDSASAESNSCHLYEVLFMQTRAFSMFSQCHPNVTAIEMDRVF